MSKSDEEAFSSTSGDLYDEDETESEDEAADTEAAERDVPSDVDGNDQQHNIKQTQTQPQDQYQRQSQSQRTDSPDDKTDHPNPKAYTDTSSSSSATHEWYDVPRRTTKRKRGRSSLSDLEEPRAAPMSGREAKARCRDAVGKWLSGTIGSGVGQGDG